MCIRDRHRTSRNSAHTAFCSSDRGMARAPSRDSSTGDQNRGRLEMPTVPNVRSVSRSETEGSPSIDPPDRNFIG
eukprot:15476400-Alexandrium_andersonii.AAC.1